MGLSLNNLRRKKKEIEEKNKILKSHKLPEDSFTYDDFLHYWNIYLEKLNANHEKNLLSILKTDQPKIEGNFILMNLPNKAIKDEILQNKEQILGFLKEKLNNYKIDFQLKIDTKKKEEFIYYPKDKLKKMIEKNPDVLYLKNKLNLDF